MGRDALNSVIKSELDKEIAVSSLKRHQELEELFRLSSSASKSKTDWKYTQVGQLTHIV